MTAMELYERMLAEGQDEFVLCTDELLQAAEELVCLRLLVCEDRLPTYRRYHLADPTEIVRLRNEQTTA